MRVRTIIVSVVALLFVASIFGCKDHLFDSVPKDEISSETFWREQSDAVTAVNAIYSFLPGIQGEVAWDMLSDIGHTNGPANFRQSIESGEHDSSLDFFENLWDDHYAGIRAVNYFLDNVERVSENDPLFSQELLARLSAEARVIRSFLYMRLSFWFGDVPLITDPITVEEGTSVAETSREGIFDFIASELTEVADDLPVEYSGEDIGRITKGAALAVKARAMLYDNRWQEAAEAANEVIELGVYELYDDYGSLFDYDAQNNREVILDRQYSKGTVENSFFASYAPTSLNGTVGIAPTRTYVDAFETVNGLSIEEDPEFNEHDPYSNRDPRLGYSIWVPTFSDDVPGDVLYSGQVYDPRPGSGTGDEMERDHQRTKTGFGTKKYINEADVDAPASNGTNFILIRYADVLLMYAEAKIELGEIDESVYYAINEVRSRPSVDMPPISSGKTQDDLREIVRHERMVELGMEGLRFWDIRRWRIAEDVMQGSIPGMRYVPVGGGEIRVYDFGGTTRAFDSSRDYLFPKPAQELTLNPNLEQNPGY